MGHILNSVCSPRQCLHSGWPSSRRYCKREPVRSDVKTTGLTKVIQIEGASASVIGAYRDHIEQLIARTDEMYEIRATPEDIANWQAVVRDAAGSADDAEAVEFPKPF